MGKITLPETRTLALITTLIEPRMPEPHSPALPATDSLLLRQFRLFVEEVMRLLATFEREHFGIETDIAAARKAAEDACDTLSREIASQTMEISRIGSPSDRAAVDELRYLKAALADELLLTHPWPGKTCFTDYLIETRLFGSSLAGDEIFKRIDALLNEASGQPSQMAPLYLFAISTGFEGRHRGPHAEAALQSLRDALFKKIYRREPALMSGLAEQPAHAERVMSEQAYRYQLSHIAPVRFFRFSRSTLIFILTMVLLLVFSQLMWRLSSAPVRRALEPGTPVKLQPSTVSEVDRG